MFVKNSNFVIYLVLAALVGFGASALIFSGSQDSLLSGDISKATRYNNVVEDPTFTAVEERLLNDKEYFDNVKSAYSLIGIRMDDLDSLSKKTIDVCSNIPEFREAIKTVVMINAKAYNTKQAVYLACSGLDKIASGKKAPEYEQASNNVFLGFNKVEYQLSIGKTFVEEAVKYLEGKDGEEYSEIADLATAWSFYCVQDAILNDSDEDKDYWTARFSDMADGSSSALTKSFSDKVAQVALASNLTDLQSSLDATLQSNLTDLQSSLGATLQSSLDASLQSSLDASLQSSLDAAYLINSLALTSLQSNMAEIGVQTNLGALSLSSMYQDTMELISGLNVTTAAIGY